MEHTASCRERASSTCLTHVYRCLQSGLCPSHSAAEVAGVIFSRSLGGEDRQRAPAGYCHDNSLELTYISLTLVEKIISSLTSSLTSHSLPPPVALFCAEIVHQFHAEDQLLSHLTAKSGSTWVFYHLLKSGTVCPVWEQMCVQAFHNSTPGTELDACLWSLTEVLKRLLKGAHQEILWKLLAVFDSSLSVLCSKFIPEERREEFTHSRLSGTTFCLLLDLLEVLTASSLICGADVCFKSQRLTHIHSSALLTTISCSSQYFVKKRVLLLLKKAVLQKAGEDWALGEVLLSGLKYERFNSDMSMLSRSVLIAVAADWLQSVQVESASFFGGTRHIGGDEGQKPDCVMLSGVSLLLLKSMELHIQTAGGTAGVDGATEVYGYLQSLCGFLKKNRVELMEVTHPCCWVSLLFGEQDDDMMEASKALLSIFLHHRLSGLEESAELEAACASGCNPHCHFLLLLQSISFDHSILLDFLISTETCFLEYFVRYLKYLRADWQGFKAACGKVSVSDCHLSLQNSRPDSGAGDLCELTYKGEPEQVGFSLCVQPTDSPVETISMAAGIHLVEYSSSDESDPENMDCQDAPGTSVCDNGRFSASDVKQKISGPPIIKQQYESSHPPGLLSQSNSAHERTPEGSSSLTGHMSCPATAPLSGQVTCETSVSAVLCLSQLREVVTRLQTKKLFPYNPSSLIKLLEQVQDCFQQTHLSHFNE
ncbi:protein Lines homolog 1 isoform X2 [Pagrus major]|uniref:protein Lines homolog 1 isoform X2 n=1 Tax=Pagrus major TaxID=143350 RepID=UPI003CC8CC0B